MTEAAVENKCFWNERGKKWCLELLIWVWSLQKSTYPNCSSTAGILRVFFSMFSSQELEHNVWRHLKMFPLWQRGSIFMRQVEKRQRSYNIKYSQWCRNGRNTLLFQQKTGGGEKSFYLLCDNSEIAGLSVLWHVLVQLFGSIHC